MPRAAGKAAIELNLRGADDRLDAGAAEAVERERGDFLRNARFETDVARAVDGVARGLQRVADDDVVDLFRRDAAARERFLRGERRRDRWR